MEFDWSEQSPHIRTLFRAWQPGDGYDEATIQAAETRLEVRLPATLRNFYLAWGRRRDLTQARDPLLSPDELKFRGDALLFWAENQGVFLWGIQRKWLEEADPPVSVAWNVEEGLEWTSGYAYLSDFLDDMTYQHALHGGALYGGFSEERVPEAQRIHWLEEHWHKARESPTFLEGTLYSFKWQTIYIREGQAVSWSGLAWWAAANSAEGLDKIAQALQITWEERW